MARTDTLGNFLIDVADAIRTKKGSSDTILASNFDTEIENLPSGGGATEAVEKDVNFYDHTGFRHYSYTKSEFLALESMPTNPEIEGLTAQGWNWSLQDAQDYVEEYGGLDIGQMYITDDNSTRIYIELQEGRLKPFVGFSINGTATIDWGDGETSTVTGTNTYTVKNTPHEYQRPGVYIISISSDSKIYFTGSSMGGFSKIVNGNNNYYIKPGAYQEYVKKIHFGKDVVLGSYALIEMRGLTEITFPNDISFTSSYGYLIGKVDMLHNIILSTSMDTLSNYFFYSANSISLCVFPGTMTSPFNGGMGGCYCLKNTYLPNFTKLGANFFQQCNSVTKVIVPKTITQIGGNSFASMSGIAIVDFTHHTSIPSLANSNAFSECPDDLHIIVPDNLYSDWIATSNWSTYSSKIISKSNYDNL